MPVIIKVIFSSSRFFTQTLEIILLSDFLFVQEDNLKTEKPFKTISPAFNAFSKSDWAKEIIGNIKNVTIIGLRSFIEVNFRVLKFLENQFIFSKNYFSKIVFKFSSKSNLVIPPIMTFSTTPFFKKK